MTSLKGYIDNKLEDIKVNADLVGDILHKTYKHQSRNTNRTIRKCVVVSLAVIMCFACSATALAATVPTVNDWLYSVSTGMAEMLYPINLYAEDNGIKVDVLYAVNDNRTAVVYFSVQDTTGNRVDGTTDIYNYSLDGPTAFTCEMISYDEETNTAFFRMLGTGGLEMSGKMETFSIDSFISNKTEYDWYDTAIDIESLIDDNASGIPIENYEYIGGSVGGETMNVLTPDAMDLSLGNGVDFVTISNIGFVDGQLHIQTKWTQSIDNHGWLALGNSNGPVNSDQCKSYYFRTENDTQTGDASSKHIEYVFDISGIEQLKDTSLWAMFTEDGDYTEGVWVVNFRLSDTQNIILSNIGGVAENVEISPVGIYIDGYMSTNEDCLIIVTMSDGSQVCLKSYTSYSKINALFDSPINLEDVISVAINDTVVYNKST